MSRALQLVRFAPSFAEATDIVELPARAPGPDEIRVRNHWCGVNGIFDTQVARNAVDYVPIALPTLTGVEAIGIVEAVGANVTGFQPGDAAATVRFRGGYLETNTAPAADFTPAPAATPDWLALASTGVSALLALEHAGQIKTGETVAISAAAGGLGHFLVQLARQRGCHVVAICGGPEKAAFVASLGADRVIDHRAEDVGQVLDQEYKGKLDLAIDTVSGAVFDAMLRNLNWHGRLVIAGAAADLDGAPEIVTGPRISHSLYYKGASVRGFMNGLLTPLWPEARARLFALHAEGRLQVRLDIQPEAGLEGVLAAIPRLLAGQTIGKLIVNLRGETP
jgi:NADPH-dependent curcumin reductase CurA